MGAPPVAVFMLTESASGVPCASSGLDHSWHGEVIFAPTLDCFAVVFRVLMGRAGWWVGHTWQLQGV